MGRNWCFHASETICQAEDKQRSCSNNEGGEDGAALNSLLEYLSQLEGVRDAKQPLSNVARSYACYLNLHALSHLLAKKLCRFHGKLLRALKFDTVVLVHEALKAVRALFTF